MDKASEVLVEVSLVPSLSERLNLGACRGTKQCPVS